MQPQQRLLASKIRGFVCRSCLSRLQVPQRHRPQHAIQNFTTCNGSLRQKGGLPPGSALRFFEETPDGERIEIEDDLDDLDEQSIIDAIQNEVGTLPGGAPGGRRGLNGPNAEGIIEAAEDLEEAGPEEFQENEPYTLPLQEWAEKAAAGSSNPQVEELRNLADAVAKVDLKNLSDEERVRLRELFLKPSVTDTAQAPKPPVEYTPPTKTFTASPPGKRSSKIVPPEKANTSPPVMPKPLPTSDVLIPIETFPEFQRPRIKQLNNALKPSARRRRGSRKVIQGKSRNDGEQLLETWKAYSLSRHSLTSSPHLVPARAWKALWNVFQVEGLHNLDRMARIKTLGDDMRKSGVALDNDQLLLYIEAFFIEGDRDIAIRMWGDYVSLLGKNHPPRKAYWEMGVRMFAQNGQPDEALEAAVKRIQIDEDPVALRILLPIMRAYLTLGTKASPKRAWALYIRLRVGLADQMTMEDYDPVASMFLKANQPDLALGVFKDMMLTGQLSVAAEDSTALYTAAIGGHNDFTSLSVASRELDWQSSQTLSKLPRRFNNKFFFGKWIKKLIGDGELEAAEQVFELMRDHRIKPSAIQMNGLIGAWFREGSEKSKVLAEDMAWRMIAVRLKSVGQEDSLQAPLRTVKTDDLSASKDALLMPSATTETFTILVQQYRQRQKQALMAELFQALKKARVRVTTYLLNQLLLVDQRAHDGWAAAQTYQTITGEQQVAPDFDTYAILWELLRKDIDPVTQRSKMGTMRQRAKKCRKLFAEMNSKLPALTKKEAFPPALYELIIQTFSIAQDLPGTAVALLALRRRFSIFPQPDTTRGIVIRLARLGMVGEDGRAPKRFDAGNSITQERIATVTNILQRLKEERMEALAQQGIAFEELPDTAKLEETTLLISNLLRFAEGQVRLAEGPGTEGKDFDLAHRSRRAAQVMGVPDCVPWAVHVDDVV